MGGLVEGRRLRGRFFGCACMTRIERFALFLHGWGMRFLQPAIRWNLRRRGRYEPGYLDRISERFGFYEKPVLCAGFVWVHAVSLGETRASAVLIEALRVVWPGMRLLMTHSTATGLAQGRALLRQGDEQAWLPWDTPEATQRFLRHFQPRLGILMETEVWPCLVESCVQASVPLVLANARMSDKSLRSALRWSWLSGPAYGRLSVVLAQTDVEAGRLKQLGTAVQGVLGNLKYDVRAQPDALAKAGGWRSGWLHRGRQRPVVMLASFREGEEALWLNRLCSDTKRLRRFEAMGVLWLLVPRHPQRFDSVCEKLQAKGVSVFRRSAWLTSDALPLLGSDTQVLFGDSVGEMPVYFQCADLALLGGSFMSFGGQNLIEAAAFGCPVVMGPHTFNFEQAAVDAQHCGAAVRVQDMDKALDQTLLWLQQPSDLVNARLKGLALVAQSRGAAQRYARAIAQEINLNK